MILSKRYQELNDPTTEEAYLFSQDGIPLPGQIMKLLLTSIYLVLPWREVPFKEERAFKKTSRSPEMRGITVTSGGFHPG